VSRAAARAKDQSLFILKITQQCRGRNPRRLLLAQLRGNFLRLPEQTPRLTPVFRTGMDEAQLLADPCQRQLP
jgi:hypothetical protein